MPSSVRSFFRRRHQSRNKAASSSISLSQLTAKTNLQGYAVNISCCGGDEKKNLTKEQNSATQIVKEIMEEKRISANHTDTNDHKIINVTKQQAANINMDDDLSGSLGKKAISKAILYQLAQRAVTSPMNLSNDDPPRTCSKKHCSFANEPLTIKPVTCVPGVGRRHGDLCEKQGIVMAHQLLSRYIMSLNDQEFEKSLIGQLGFTARSAAMARDGLKEMRRHLI